MKRLGIAALLGMVLLWSARVAVAGSGAEPDHLAASEFSAALGAATLSAAYFPVKFACSLGGALVGGVGGFLTGGDERTAEGIWRGVVEGDYFVRPEHILGEEPFKVNGAQWGEDDVLEGIPGAS